MEALPSFLESPAGKEEATANAVTMLTQMSDFSEFKEMMMFIKKDREEKAANAGDLLGETKASDGAVLNVDGLLDMCAELATSAQSDEGWVTAFQNDWMKIDKKEVPPEVRRHKNEIYLRGVMTMNLSFVEVVDMMLYFGERRRLWDKNYAGHETPLGQDAIDDDDAVLRSKLDFGTLLHLAGMPSCASHPKLETVASARSLMYAHVRVHNNRCPSVAAREMGAAVGRAAGGHGNYGYDSLEPRDRHGA